MDFLYQGGSESNTQDISLMPAIIVCDASGSTLTRSEFRGLNHQCLMIFEKMEIVVENLPHNNFRIVFWNSNTGNQFRDGVMVIPFVVTKATLSQSFKMVKTKMNGNCLTFPHLGFEAIPSEWWSKTESNHVYFITDGQITDKSSHGTTTRQKLATSIRNMISNALNVQLRILTIENTNLDFNDMEALRTAAGSDVFEVIQREGLTDLITEFTSFTLNHPDGFTQMSTPFTPPGYIPFEGKSIFHEAKTGEFIAWLYQEIQGKLTDENHLLRILQNLTNTIRSLTKDKSTQISIQIIQNFSELFRGSAIEPMMVNFMLTDAIDLANQGKSEVFAKYRANLKDFYKMANELLIRNVKNATGILRSFVSLPAHGSIITGPSQLVDQTIILSGTSLPKCAVKVNHLSIPVLPLEITGTHMTEQCLRQYIRMIIASQYGVDKLGDVVIYVILGLTMIVVNSQASEDIKTAYRQFSVVMLKKKRVNTNVTEIERLEAGEFPTPNSGIIEHFNEFMITVNGILGTTAHPMVLWYAMCQSLNNPRMILKQLPHCREAVLAAYGEIPQNIASLLLVGITCPQVKTISETFALDYTCLITLDDCSAVGGYKFLPHATPTDQICCPNHVFSQEGYTRFIANHDQFCPICYTVLNSTSFESVPPKSTEGIIFSDDLTSVYTKVPPMYFDPQTRTVPRLATQVASASTPVPNQKKILFKMRGNVGSGKSTYAAMFQQKLESLGLNMTVFNEGTDKYCKMGVQIKDSANRVKAQLGKLSSVTTEYVVVIIDTCDDKGSGSSVFNYNFSDWTIHTVMPNYDSENIRGYLEWSLQNVLTRPLHSSTTMFYLNPVSASVDICLKVHTDKGRNLFNNRFVKVYSHLTKDQILSEIKSGAETYQIYLDQHHVRDTKIDELVTKVVNA